MRPVFRLPAVLLLFAAGALPAAGIEIGDAPSLPWEGDGDYGLVLEYAQERIADDVIALLGPDVPLLVRYETLRRAAEYTSYRGRNVVGAPGTLTPRLTDRRRDGGALADFDFGCWSALRSKSAYAPSAEMREALKDQAAELAYVIGLLDPQGGIAEAALEGAREGSLLARNLLRDFDNEYGTVEELRASLARPWDPGDGPMFPQPPPVPDADPAVRHGATLLAPWRLIVRRGEEGTEVTWPKETPRRVRVELGHRMRVGTRITYRVLVAGKPVAEHDSEALHGGEPIHAASATSYLKEVPTGAIVEAKMEIFETDIPPQHLWSPTSGRYRVLWTHTYEAPVP